MNPYPSHLAFIMDGNRRWALSQGRGLIDAYQAGGNKLCEILVHFFQRKKNMTLSFYAFSKENWGRPDGEIDILFSTITPFCQQVKKQFIPGQIKICFIGDRAAWPLKQKHALESLECQYSQEAALKVIIAVNYSGQWDIEQAVSRASERGCPQTWAQMLQLSSQDCPQILIRTGMQSRLSNYYLYHLAYTELYFPKVFWPDLTMDNIEEIVNNYRKTQRNFGRSAFPAKEDILCEQ